MPRTPTLLKLMFSNWHSRSVLFSIHHLFELLPFCLRIIKVLDWRACSLDAKVFTHSCIWISVLVLHTLIIPLAMLFVYLFFSKPGSSIFYELLVAFMFIGKLNWFLSRWMCNKIWSSLIINCCNDCISMKSFGA